MGTRRGTAVALGLVLVAGSVGASAGAEPAPKRPVTTIAIVGDAGVNPLHDEFRTVDGRDPAYPPGMPKPVRIALPRTPDAEAALAELREGPLGDPKPGTLYAVAGTRLLIYAPPGEPGVLEDRAHGTGTASSAGGRTIGSSPESLIVVVPGTRDSSYDWLARQRWIDVASTSVYAIRTTEQCAGAAGARALHADGGLLFSSSGNAYDYYEALSIPNGLPEVYQVGGVDRTGRTWLLPRPEENEPLFALGNVVRPYETGARYSFPAASPDGRTGTQPFGGTSGATPTVAGYAAELVAEARRLLKATGPRTATALAVRRPGTALPRRGPLADGDFTRDELVALLHNSAMPAETAPRRYLLEGFGATDKRSHQLALAVLRGQTASPDRDADREVHVQAERLREQLTSRC